MIHKGGIFPMNDIATYLLSLIIEYIIVLFFLFHIFEERDNSKSTFVTFSAGYLALFVITFLKNPLFNLVSFCLIHMLCIFLSFSCSLLYCFFASIYISTIMAVTEFFAELVTFTFFQKYRTPDLVDINITLCFIISKFLFFLVLFITASKINLKPQFQVYPSQVIILFLSFVMIISILYIVVTLEINPTVAILFDFFCFCIIAINISMIYLQEYIQQKQWLLEQTKLNLYYEKQNHKYYELVKEQDETQKILIHDIKNHLLTLKKLSENTKNSEISHYISELFETPSLNTNYKVSQNRNLNLILSRYISKCHLLGINFEIDASNCDLDFLSPVEITTIFSNLLDNAVDSASNFADGFISVIIREKQKSNCVTISLVNSCLTSPSIDDQGNLKSSKSNDNLHGYGMKSIKNVISTYGGEVHSFYKEDMTFHTILYIPKHKIEK